VDIRVPQKQKKPIRFTYLWLEENRWESRDYTVNLQPKEAAARSRTNVRGGKERFEEVTTVG
jgi:hypothetical protein